MNLISKRFSNDGIPVLELSEIQRKYIRIFNEKCRNGTYSFRNRKCECGNGDFETIAQKDRYGLPVNTVICKNCGLIVTDPCLDDNSNNAFYDNEYPYIYREETTPSDEHFEERKREASSIISFIRKHTGIFDGNVLEIGCADGGNVAAFCENGYEASGIDLSHTYVEYGIKKGLNLRCCNASLAVADGIKYDLVILNQVLEHFTDIERELTVIKELLKPEGCLFIAVPGIRFMTYGAYGADFLHMLQNAHIYNFTKNTLCRILDQYGYECIYSNEFIYSTFRKSDHHKAYKNEYNDNMEYLRAVEKSNGDLRKLVFYRIEKLLSEYGNGDVLLYGTAMELDSLVGQLHTLSPIRGFFYSDKKSCDDVSEYIRTSFKTQPVKCLILADSDQNDALIDSLSHLIHDCGIDLYTIYGEVF